MSNVIIERCGNFGYELEEFEEHDEAVHRMIEMAGNDVTEEFGNEILMSDEEYQRELTNRLDYYTIRRDDVQS